jgi:hypothetical protein
MELTTFIKKFLPDYDKRWEEYKKKANVEEAYQEECFNSKYFPEALTNCVNQLIIAKGKGGYYDSRIRSTLFYPLSQLLPYLDDYE